MGQDSLNSFRNAVFSSKVSSHGDKNLWFEISAQSFLFIKLVTDSTDINNEPVEQPSNNKKFKKLITGR